MSEYEQNGLQGEQVQLEIERLRLKRDVALMGAQLRSEIAEARRQAAVFRASEGRLFGIDMSHQTYRVPR